MEDFEGDVAVASLVVRSVHLAHAAPPEETSDHIRTESSSRPRTLTLTVRHPSAPLHIANGDGADDIPGVRQILRSDSVARVVAACDAGILAL
ncbi:hypothetical protein GCM10023147_00990 [Tsukamurella soli]|uniref:Uncharacterized protein n=1 Tax=Tsukamurella soli TaxID=644556 RepID=A0ABP8J0R8_9ACTN